MKNIMKHAHLLNFSLLISRTALPAAYKYTVCCTDYFRFDCLEKKAVTFSIKGLNRRGKIHVKVCSLPAAGS